MSNKRRVQILDGTMLKIIAMISMVFDHAGDLFFPGLLWPRMIGRLAMPLFSFCIAEGYIHTRDRNRYLLRIGIFALISEFPFDLAFSGTVDWSHQNIMLTYFLAVLALMIYDRITEGNDNETASHNRAKIMLGVLAVLAAAILALVLRADYTCFAVIGVFLFYVFRNRSQTVRSVIGTGFLAITRTMSYYSATIFSLIPLLLYNGRKGRGLKWLFYVFYPGHLLILYGIKLILQHG